MLPRLRDLQLEALRTADSHGFNTPPVEKGTKIALMHSELSEALEAIRHGNPPSEHIPTYSAVEEEFADCLVRMLEFCGMYHLDLEGALLAKMEFNQTHPMRHGGKEF